MKRTLRRGLPVAVLAALIVAGVLLATRSGNEATEVDIQVPPEELGLVAGNRFCNVSLETSGGMSGSSLGSGPSLLTASSGRFWSSFSTHRSAGIS